jgi:hypothetical protein
VLNARFYNNLWSDPTGTMTDFSDTLPGEVQSFTLLRNGYWNGGLALPEDALDAVNPSDDAQALIGNPGLANQTGLQTPHWVPGMLQFNGGYATIREAFVALVENYGQPAPGSIGIDQGLGSEMPADDILGRNRGAQPDLGAYERIEVDPDQLFADGFES